MPITSRQKPLHKAVLLAAGGSRRLGQPKQNLTHHQVPLVRHAAELLRATRPVRLIVVVNDAGLSEQLDGLDVRIVHNPLWERGLSGSIQAALRAMPRNTAPILFAAVDQILLDQAHLQALLSSGGAGRDVATRYDAHGFGIPALVTPQTLRLAAGLTGDRGFGQIWSRARGTPLLVDAPQLAFDLDTPSQLSEAVRRGWIDAPSTRSARNVHQGHVRVTILQAAERLFDAQGFDTTTLDQVAQSSGVGKRSLFRYFATKEDMALAWIDDAAPAIGAAIGAAIGGAIEGAAGAAATREDPPRPVPAWMAAATWLPVACAALGDETILHARLARAGRSAALARAMTARLVMWEDAVADALEGHGRPDAMLCARVAIAILRTAIESWDRQAGPSLDTVARALADRLRP